MIIRKSLVALAALLLPSPFSPVSGTSASSTTSLRVDTVTHGVKLSLIVPRRTYPRNALIQVTVRLQNVSRRTVLVSSGINGPTVVVLDSAKQVVYSPESPFMDDTFMSILGGGPRPPIKLAPHKSWTPTFFVILRGPVLQAQALLGARGKELEVDGAPVPITLTDAAAPAVLVSDAPTIHATVTPPPGALGPPIVMEETHCSGNGISSEDGWDGASSDDLTPDFAPDCVSPRTWIAYAGWLGYPIATVSYSGP